MVHVCHHIFTLKFVQSVTKATSQIVALCVFNAYLAEGNFNAVDILLWHTCTPKSEHFSLHE